MLFGESAEAVGVDQAWSDLRHHLDWTKGEPTVVFLAAQSHDQVDDHRERTVLWCRRNRERWTLCEPDAGSVDWLRRELLRSGVLWLDLWEEGCRVEVLHALNELRIRLSCSGGGCLVLCGPVPLLGESAYEAVDRYYEESTTILRELADLLGTPRAIEDLTGALFNRALTANRLGDSALAEQLEAEMSGLKATVADNQP